jgi:sugar lactone lactonase YvrE
MTRASALVLGLATMLRAADVAPTNDLPQPYRTVRDWGHPPGGLPWASVTAVEPAPDGTIYVIYRCHENSCDGRPEDPILVFDKSGKLVRSWGAGMFVFPHGSTLDREGNLWVTDGLGSKGKGHQVFKFSPTGKVLMTLGRAGVAGEGPDTFRAPTDVAIAPNGDIFVADGHRDSASGVPGNNRIVKFSKDGKFIKQWGQKGTGPGDIQEPHSIAFDSQGRLFVADRINNRIEIFNQDGKFLEEWKQFSRPSGLYITKDDTLYVADSESGPDHGARERPGWKKGIRIGSARTGKLTAFIEDMEPLKDDHSGAEGLGVDSDGNVYGAVVRRMMLEKHILK